MTAPALPEVGARPTATEFKKVQHAFRGAPATAFGAALVLLVGNEGEDHSGIGGSGVARETRERGEKGEMRPDELPTGYTENAETNF